jgi:hypothetical protein
MNPSSRAKLTTRPVCNWFVTSFTFGPSLSKDPKISAKQISREKIGWHEPVGETMFGLWEYFQATSRSGVKKIRFLAVLSDNT